MTHTIYADEPDSIKKALTAYEWGYTRFSGGITFLTCPWCMALIPDHFTNAHEPGVSTPKDVHIEYHMHIAQTIKYAGSSS